MTKRWSHKSIAQSNSVPEDVVRRIYATVQTSKRQGLYGGYMADLVERNVGRKLIGGEYTVYKRAKEHLAYDPPSGYGGPKPSGGAKEPPRVQYGDPRANQASRIVERAESAIRLAQDRLKDRGIWGAAGDRHKDREALRVAADELCVGADLYEEAGAGVRAGTLRRRAAAARQGDVNLLSSYHLTKKTAKGRSHMPKTSKLDRDLADVVAPSCTTCGRSAGDPYRRRFAGKIVEGCIDDAHTGHLYGDSLRWHMRPVAKAHRASMKARRKELLAPMRSIGR